jgi:hypothetical protein
MSALGELLASDHRQTLEFFFRGLLDLSGAAVDREEVLYNASVLAHYSQVSTSAAADLPAPTDLGTVFDTFVVDAHAQRDGHLMETAGAQCLLLTGFFEDQMRARHNVRWYSRLGASFFGRAAAAQQHTKRKARLLDRLAVGFEPWRQRHAQLSRELRDQAYMLSIRATPKTSLDLS